MDFLFRKHHVSNCEGYTLLELMVASMILLLVSSGIYTLFVYSARAFEHHQAEVVHQQELRRAFVRLSLDLANLVAPSVLYPVSFHGTDQELTMYVDLDGGISRVSYRLMDRSGLPSLIRHVSTDDPELEWTLDLLTGYGIEMSYYDANQDRWRSAWDMRFHEEVPAAIQLHLIQDQERFITLTFPIYTRRNYSRGIQHG